MRALEPIASQHIDKDALKVVRRLLQHDFETYLVGGCVRDLLLGRRPKDFDVATSATPEEIRMLFRNSRIIGRRFRLVHIYFHRKIIETATFRSEPKDELNSEDPLIWRDNEFGTAEEDARRRDFTINGLFYDVATGKVVDNVDGLGDLRQSLVKTIGDPEIRMQEDPVRILRAVMFASRLGFDIHRDTWEAMQKYAHLVPRCSNARLLEEIYKLLRTGAAKPTFGRLKELGLLGSLFPEIGMLFGELELPVLRAGNKKQNRQDDIALETLDSDELDEVALSKLSALASLDGEDFEEMDESSENDFLMDENSLVIEAELAQERSRVDELYQILEIDEEEHLLEIREQLWAQLAALDELVTTLDEPPRPPLLLAALLSPLVRVALGHDRRMGKTTEQVDAMISAIGIRLQVARRHRERLKQILVAQRRLTQSRPKAILMQRDYFPQAFMLLQLRAKATGRHDASIGRWEDLFGDKRRRKHFGRRRPPSGMTRRSKGHSK